MKSIIFHIKDNSMAPTIFSGDSIICKELEALDTFETLEENELYTIITTSGSILVKRIQKVRNQHNRIVQLKLISDNKLAQMPFKISISNIYTLLRVEQKLTAIA